MTGLRSGSEVMMFPLSACHLGEPRLQLDVE